MYLAACACNSENEGVISCYIINLNNFPHNPPLVRSSVQKIKLLGSGLNFFTNLDVTVACVYTLQAIVFGKSRLN